MKMKKRKILMMLLVGIVIGINTISLSKYKDDLQARENLEIAKPIINVIKAKKVESEIFENSPEMEYDFVINNYVDNQINEVDLDYVIEITASETNFPIEYELYDAKTNKVLPLTDGKSEKLTLKSKQKEERHFKIIVRWKELTEELAENVDLNLRVKAEQAKGG